MRARTPTKLTHAIAFLHRDYRPEFFWWELVEIVRRVVLTGWLVLIPERVAFLRLVFAVLTSISALLLTLAKSPYRHLEDQMLAVANNFLLTVIFIGAW